MAGVPEPVQPEGAEESSDSSEETAVVLALGSDSLLSGAESSVEGEAVSAPPVGMSGAALTDRDPDCEKEEEDKLDDHTQECSTSDTGGSGLFPRASTPCPALPSPPRAPSPSLEEEMGNTLEEEEEEGKSGASSPQPTTAETSASSAVTVPSTLPPELAKKFRILRKIGEGTFSSVYLAEVVTDGDKRARALERVALKHIIPTSLPARIIQEIRCLRMLEGKMNVVPLRCVLREGGDVVFVMPFFPHHPFTSYFRDMPWEELGGYLRNLMLALSHVHSKNIIHRDIKPANFLYDRTRRRYCLIDFGLAQWVDAPEKKPESVVSLAGPSTRPPKLGPASRQKATRTMCDCFGQRMVCQLCVNKPLLYAPRAGTPGFRAPEILLRFTKQTTALDVWSIGVIILCICSGRYPFFRGTDDCTALAEIMTLLGSKPMQDLAAKKGKRLVISTLCKAKNLRDVCEGLRGRRKSQNPSGEEEAPDDDGKKPISSGYPDGLYSLLAKLLTIDPDERVSSAAAYEDPVISDHPLPPPAS